MDNNSNLWPLEQLFQWLHHCNTKKFCRIPKIALPTLIAITKFAHNVTWECNPSIPTIANLAFIHRDNVIEHIKLLEKEEIISVTREGNKSNKYKINTDNLWITGAFCVFDSRKIRLGSRKIRLSKRVDSRKIRPELAFALTSSRTSFYEQKAENEKRHDFAQSMDQMANEKKNIQKHEELKSIEKGSPMPDEIKIKLGLKKEKP